MKQVIHNFTIEDLTFQVVLANLHDLEDGFWELSFITESATATLPPFFAGQAPTSLPGHVVRITGAQLTRVMDPTCSITDRSNCLEIRGGKIVQRTPDGISGSNTGPEANSQVVGTFG